MPVNKAARITVGLTPQATHAMSQLQQQTTMNQTELVNRALVLYERLIRDSAQGHEVYIHDPDTQKQTFVLLS